MTDFWNRYASLMPRIENACRAMSRMRTGGGMSPEEMQAWIDDRVWRMRRQREFPIFHDDPDDETAVARVRDHIPLLVRWAFLARSRAFFRRKAREESYANAFARAERLASVRRADEILEQAEQV
ncbi:MAG: hypothetical protein KDA28_01410, partial [Phycisphaerales bacterium]|nr:hypothetical protein [Phycisphaerales bacterium]